MNHFNNYWTYSSQEDQGQAYPYGYNWEQSQRHYEEERFHENYQRYDDGGHYYDNGMQDQGPSQNQVSSNAQNNELKSILATLLENQAKASQENMMLLQTINQELDDLATDWETLENPLAQPMLENSDNEVEDCSNEQVPESFEDQPLDNTFEMLGQASEGNQDEEDSITGHCLRGLFSILTFMDEQEEPRELEAIEDLVELDEDLSGEPPHPQENASFEENVELWAPKNAIEDLEEWTPTELGSGFEDPYLFMPPPSKFQNFLPFIAKSLERNLYDPSTLMEAYLSRGSYHQLEVHRRLDGRKFNWDLKVD